MTPPPKDKAYNSQIQLPNCLTVSCCDCSSCKKLCRWRFYEQDSTVGNVDILTVVLSALKYKARGYK